MRLHPIAALAAVPALVLALAACAPTEEPQEPETIGTDSPVACTPSGPISEAISVSDNVGEQPEIDFNAPVSVSAVQRTVVVEGDGPTLQDNAIAQIHFTLVNGESGTEIDSTGYTVEGLFQANVDENVLLSGLVKTIRCAKVGSRIVSVVPPTDAFGSQGNESLGINPDDALVFVVDVVDVLQPAAWEDDVPEVTFADDGTPTVTLPDTAPPAELVMTVLEQGDGETVTASSAPQLDYQGTSWDTGEVFDQSYGKQPIALPATQYVKGFTAALLGQKVGSTLLVSIPPALAYGTDPAAHDLGGQTLVFLIQIRSIS